MSNKTLYDITLAHEGALARMRNRLHRLGVSDGNIVRLEGPRLQALLDDAQAEVVAGTQAVEMLDCHKVRKGRRVMSGLPSLVDLVRPAGGRLH